MVFLSNLVHFGLIFLVPAWVHGHKLIRTNTSGLCSRNPVQSCAHLLATQFDPVDLDSCRFSAANSSKGLCNRNAWNHSRVCSDAGLCGVHLRVYRHTLPGIPLYRTALNLTLSKSSSRIRIRYVDLLAKEFSFCINFDLSPVLSPRFLWYDCVFHDRSYEDRPFLMEFLTGETYGSLLFKIPSEDSLAKHHVFLYLHFHQSNHPIITFQRISEQETYLVIVCKWVSDSCVEISKTLVNTSDQSSYLHKWEDLVTLGITTLLSRGNYSVLVDGTSTPFFIIDGEDWPGILLWLVAGFLLAASVALVVLYCWKHLRGKPVTGENPATILLVHDPETSDRDQVEAVRSLLMNQGGFGVWLDVIDIPLSGHKDPLIWYTRAVDQADVVAVWISQPTDSRNSGPRVASGSIYQHTFPLALDLLAGRLKKRLALASVPPGSAMDTCVVLVTDQPANVEPAVPELCRPLRRFRIPGQLAELVRHVKRHKRASGHATDPADVPKAAEDPEESVNLLTDKATPTETKSRRQLLDEAFGIFPPSAFDVVDSNAEGGKMAVKAGLKDLNLL